MHKHFGKPLCGAARVVVVCGIDHQGVEQGTSTTLNLGFDCVEVTGL